jgi:AraC-like DNA-binding protein
MALRSTVTVQSGNTLPALDGAPFESRFVDGRTLRLLARHPRAAAAVRYACCHLDEPIRLEHIGALTGMNPCAFSRYFADAIEVSFFALVRIIRIERAIEILQRRDCSIADVAELTGYGNSWTFTRAFKTVVGSSPTEFRRRYVGGL